MKNIVVSVFISLGWLASAAGTAWANGESGGESGLRGLVEPLGVLTFLCLAATFLLGRFMPRNRKKFFPWHKRMAWVTVCSAVVHLLLVALSG